MVFIVNYDIKDLERKDSFLSAAKNIGETLQYLPHALFIDCPDPNLDKDGLYSQLKQATSNEDLFLVAQTSLSVMSGWLTSSAVDWLKKHNQ